MIFSIHGSIVLLVLPEDSGECGCYELQKKLCTEKKQHIQRAKHGKTRS